MLKRMWMVRRRGRGSMADRGDLQGRSGAWANVVGLIEWFYSLG